MISMALGGLTAVGVTLDFTESVVNFFKSLVSSIPSQEQDMLSIIKMDPSMNPFDGVSMGITSVLTNYATVICGVLFMIEFLKYTIKIESVKFEYVVGLGLKFAVAKAALSIGGTIIDALTATANDLVTAAARNNTVTVVNAADGNNTLVLTDATVSGNVDKIVEIIQNTLNDLNFIQAIVPLVTLLLPLLAIKIILYVGVVMAYGRMFELTMYRMMYPLPCGMLLLDHGRIPKRFFASYCACALQGPIMVLSVQLFEAFLTKAVNEAKDANDLSSLAFTMLMAGLMMVMGMLKSGQWASKIVGEG